MSLKFAGSLHVNLDVFNNNNNSNNNNNMFIGSSLSYRFIGDGKKDYVYIQKLFWVLNLS